MDDKDIELQVRKLEREVVVLVVAKELDKLSQEVVLATLDSIGKPEFKSVDTKTWANKIISIVKEHSV
jgi:hypothetical protein